MHNPQRETASQGFTTIYADEQGREIVHCLQPKPDPRVGATQEEVVYRVRRFRNDMLQHVSEQEAMKLRDLWGGEAASPPGR